MGLKRGETLLRRSYSAASAPGKSLQFLISHVEDGQLTPSLFDLTVGSEVFLDETPLGFFTLNEVPDTKHLWLVATGTGLGPYLSMLRAGELERRFESVSVIHGVRHEEQLCHRDELTSAASSSSTLRYIPICSAARDPQSTSVSSGRITTAWDSGALETLAGPFGQECHMLLCGNPQMIEDMTSRLKERGFEKHRRRKPGHFNFEKYW